jgi:hypothetical protein
MVVSGVGRLNSDGTLDSSFNAHLEASANVSALAVQPDNRVLLAGSFVCGAGPVCQVIRLREDGSFDPDFQALTGADGPVTDLLLQKDGRVLIAGGFKSINGVPRAGIARLLGDVMLFDPMLTDDGWSASAATVAGKSYKLESKDSLSENDWHPGVTLIGDGAVNFFLDPAPTPPLRFYRIRRE